MRCVWDGAVLFSMQIEKKSCVSLVCLLIDIGTEMKIEEEADRRRGSYTRVGYYSRLLE